MIEPLRISVDVACGPEHAFATWTERFGRWWPRGHTASGDPGATVVLEAGVGGRFGNDVPPVLEHLGLAEVEHGARNNRMRVVS